MNLTQRPRRLRRSGFLRDLVAEHAVRCEEKNRWFVTTNTIAREAERFLAPLQAGGSILNPAVTPDI